MIGLKRGFTLVELIVVIAVIGILAAVTIVGLGRYQADTRDSRRASNATVIAEALEKYYDQNGEYPGCLAVEAAASVVSTSTLKGINASALKAPLAPSDQSNSIECIGSPELTIAGDDFFEYDGDGSADCSGGSSCLAFSLKYKDEVDGEIKTIDSRRKTEIATSGSLTLSGSAVDSVSIALSWNTISNATGYTVQKADNNSFTTGLVESTTSTNSSVVGGLTRGVGYFFRVKANSAGSESAWSNIVNVTTLDLHGPTITSTSGTANSITINWGAVVGATSYRLEYSTSSGFSPLTTINGIVVTNRTVSSLPAGTLYYVKVYALNGATLGDPSDVAQVNTIVSPPSTPTISAGMVSTNAVGTTSATCAAGTAQYGIRYHSENTGSSGAYSSYSAYAATTTRSVAASQGYRYVFQAQARCTLNGYFSTTTTSGEANVVRAISKPSAAALSVDTTSWAQYSGHAVNYATYCPAGTSMTSGPSYGGGFQSSGFEWNDGVDYYHGWGFVDSWSFDGTGGTQIRYRTDYRCSTTYSTSPNADTTTSYITIY